MHCNNVLVSCLRLPVHFAGNKLRTAICEGKGTLIMSFTAMHLYFDDVEIGQEWQSLGRTITEADIVHFAGLSGDFNPIHIDHEFARTTPFRKPIAHGLLVLSIGSGLGLYAPPMRTMAIIEIREWRFLEPVYAGDTIRVRTKVLGKEARARGKRGSLTWQRQIVNQDGKTVQEGVTQTLVEGRASIRSSEEGQAEGEENTTIV
jgi:3-hydroxybutyryl-CoA dehydratase